MIKYLEAIPGSHPVIILIILVYVFGTCIVPIIKWLMNLRTSAKHSHKTDFDELNCMAAKLGLKNLNSVLAGDLASQFEESLFNYFRKRLITRHDSLKFSGLAAFTLIIGAFFFSLPLSTADNSLISSVSQYALLVVAIIYFGFAGWLILWSLGLAVSDRWSTRHECKISELRAPFMSPPNPEERAKQYLAEHDDVYLVDIRPRKKVRTAQLKSHCNVIQMPYITCRNGLGKFSKKRPYMLLPEHNRKHPQGWCAFRTNLYLFLDQFNGCDTKPDVIIGGISYWHCLVMWQVLQREGYRVVGIIGPMSLRSW